MNPRLRTGIVAIAVPLVVFLAGGWLLQQASRRSYVHDRLNAHAAEADRKPLNLRFGGYDRDAVQRHWSALDADALGAERRFLELDLVFPTFYGAALLGGLLLAWNARGRRPGVAWLIAPVVLGVVADWTENLTQLEQLTAFAHGGAAALDTGAIRVASAATIAKLSLLTLSVLSLFGLVFALVRSRPIDRHS